ncbi:MAG: hypothetical protein IJ134_03170 [Bacilli bacterium]|nr:hypothetical protein [Bacilli bacterium]
MKYIKWLIICFFTFLICNLSVSAFDQKVEISLNKSETKINNNVIVTISLPNDVDAWDFTVNYDKNKLKIVNSSLEDGNARSVGTNLTNNTKSYTMEFKTLSAGNTSISISDSVFYDSNENLLNVDINSSNLTIKGLDGLKYDDGNYYLYDENGNKKTGFQVLDGKTYFFSRVDGRLRTGMFQIDGIVHYFDEEGVMQTGLHQIGENKYYFESDGKRYEKGFKILNGKTYFFSRVDGRLRTGMFQIDGKMYYFNEEGVMQTGYQTVNGIKYFFHTDGHMHEGWFEKDGRYYYIDEKGQLVTGWQIIEGKKCYFNQLGQLIAKDAKLIIDVSSHQNTIDWDYVVNNNLLDGVILRAGYGSYSEDIQFAHNIDSLRRLNIPYGVYLFSYAENKDEARSEANFLSNVIKKYNLNPTLGTYYDIETWNIGNYYPSISTNSYDEIISTFINTMESNGYNTSVYTYLNYANNVLSADMRKYVTWIAHYSDNCGYTGSYNMWQYGSTYINGIGEVDGNVKLY